MNTTSAVTNATARLTMDSVNRLIQIEVNAATAKLRASEDRLKRAVEALQNQNASDKQRAMHVFHRDGQMMVVIGIGCGIVGVLAGYFLKAVIMK